MNYFILMKQPETFIDLFCGIGGFHQALSKCGLKCVFASDSDVSCRKVYKDNYNFEPSGDITQINILDIPSHDVLCAGFPCQPFSQSGKQNGFEDSRGTLFFNICEIIKIHRPMYLILENVKNIITHNLGNTWKVIMNSIEELGYNTTSSPLILNVLHFNIPQNRERVVILCKRNDIGLIQTLPEISKTPKKDLTNTLKLFVDDSISNQLTLKEQATFKVYSKFIDLIPDIPKFPIWTDYWDIQIDKNDPFYKKYSSWIDKNRSFYNNNKNILEPWLIESRNEPLWIGAVRKFEWQVVENNNLDNLLLSFRGSGVRVKNCDYIPTLTALSMVPVYGPLRRKLLPKELLKLQSFPDTFKFDEKTIYKQIGNAVNVKMIYRCAKFLLFNEPLFN